jgi:uncharacterized protein YjbI with pentapeptide repeats
MTRRSDARDACEDEWIVEPRDRSRGRRLGPDEVAALLDAHAAWLGSQEHTAWKEAKSDDEREKHAAPEMLDLNLQKADFRFKDLTGARLSMRFLGGDNLNLNKSCDLRCAQLTRAILHGARLRGVDLRGAHLEDTDFTDADLCFAKLHGATLHRTKFTGAAMSNVVGFDDAELNDADLEQTTGLKGNELARTNLTGAKLPESVREFSILQAVNNVSENAQTAFLSMLAACAYCWLTIATTEDARLLTNSTSSPLPVIQTPVPIAGFFWFAPFLLLAIFVWFHLYLQDMWNGLAGLPAFFPDGKALDEKANPWLLTGFVRPHFKLLRDDRPPLSRLKSAISIALAWWLVPVTIAVLWLRYLPRHDWPGTRLHVVLLTVAIVGAAALQYLARVTLRGEGRRTGPATIASLSLGLAVFVVGLLVSDGAINGRPREYNPLAPAGPDDPPARRVVVPDLLRSVGFRAFADLSETIVSTRPENWSPASTTDPLAAVIGAQLRGVDLRHADAHGAFLAKSDLRSANLEGANLREANLESADLRGANLHAATLADARLEGADLRLAVGLSQAALDRACAIERVQLPEGFTPPKKPC